MIWQDERKERVDIKGSICPTGVSYLDDGWTGGINKEQLVLVGAKTGTGKTHFGVQLAMAASRRGKNVFYFALEASKFEIERRRLYTELHRMVRENLPSFKMPRFREWLHMEMTPEWESLENVAVEKISNECTGLSVKYRTTAYSPDEFQSDAINLLSESPDLIILDHLHHFLLEGHETEALKAAIRTIDRLKNELNIPIVVLAQVRKSDGKQTKSSLSKLEDIRGSAALTDISTDVIILSRLSDEFEKQIAPGLFNPMFMHVGKSRTTPEMSRFVAVIGFDYKTGGYQDWYQLTRNREYEEPTKLTKEELPEWATRARPSSVSTTLKPLKNWRGFDHD